MTTTTIAPSAQGKTRVQYLRAGDAILSRSAWDAPTEWKTVADVKHNEDNATSVLILVGDGGRAERLKVDWTNRPAAFANNVTYVRYTA